MCSSDLNAGLGVSGDAFDGVLQRLSDGPVSPLLFGAYCDLVLALESDVPEDVPPLLAEIAAAPNIVPGPEIMVLADPASDPASNRYRRLMDTDAGMPSIIRPPAAEDVDRTRALMDAAFVLLDAGYPEMAAEIRGDRKSTRLNSSH